MKPASIPYHTGRFLLYFLAIGVAVFSMRYWGFQTMGILTLKTTDSVADPLFRLFFYGHVLFGPIALITGPVQFSPRLRQGKLPLHRALGKVYVLACLLSGLAGLGAAQYTLGGWVAEVGFSCLALAWLYTTYMAWHFIRKKEVEAHRRWMVRSFALTLAAVTLRMYLPLLEGVVGLSFVESYRIVGWLCWVPNAVVAEIWLARSPQRKSA